MSKNKTAEQAKTKELAIEAASKAADKDSSKTMDAIAALEQRQKEKIAQTEKEAAEEAKSTQVNAQSSHDLDATEIKSAHVQSSPDLDDDWGMIPDMPRMTEAELQKTRDEEKNARLPESLTYQASTSYLLEKGYESAGAVNSEQAQISAGDRGTREVFKKNTPNGVTIVTPPASDFPEKRNEYSIAQALKDGLYAAGDKRPATISVKVTQERQMLPRIANFLKNLSDRFPNSHRLSRLSQFVGQGRNHWTHLQVKIDKEGKVTALHTDSQAKWKNAIYNLDPIRAAVKEVFPDAKFKSKATGTQKDNTNCGRYAIAHEVTAVEGIERPKDPLKYAHDVLHVNERYNNFGEVLEKRATLIIPTIEQLKEEEAQIKSNINISTDNAKMQTQIQGTKEILNSRGRVTAIIPEITAEAIETRAAQVHGTPEPKEKTSRVKFAETSTTITHEVEAPKLTPTGDHGKERSADPLDKAIDTMVADLVETVKHHNYDPHAAAPKPAMRSATKTKAQSESQGRS